MSGSTVLDVPTQSVRDFYLRIVRGKSQPAPRPGE
jgi:hypothetical protein